MLFYLLQISAEVVELADALDSKSSEVTLVRVRPPPSAPLLSKILLGLKKQFISYKKQIHYKIIRSHLP